MIWPVWEVCGEDIHLLPYRLTLGVPPIEPPATTRALIERALDADVPTEVRCVPQTEQLESLLAHGSWAGCRPKPWPATKSPG
jgi:hypothetical protein